MNWGEDNTKMFDLMSRAPGLFTDALPAILGKGNGTAIDAGTGFILGAAKITEGGAVSAATGLASNPKKEMIFESVNFRTFNLDYRGRSSQPSMSQLQPVADKSDPLRIVVGNPSLNSSHQASRRLTAAWSIRSGG